MVGGVQGRLLSARGKNPDLGGNVVVHEVLVVKGKYVYSVSWVSKAGNEAADPTTFKQAVSTMMFDP